MLVLRFPFGTSQQSNVLTVIHDAFQPLSFWSNFMPSNSFDGVAMDTHIYLMFTDVCVCNYTVSPDAPIELHWHTLGRLTPLDHFAQWPTANPDPMRQRRGSS